jgi:hypothetical protein
MRKDMSKIIVERPRRGVRSAKSAKPGRTQPLEDEDGEPLRARAPRAPRGPRTKSLNENLAPLRRYLARQVDRPWNKIYSEISEHLKPTSTVQQHVRDHIEDFVATRTRMSAGAVVTLGRWGGEHPLDLDWRPFFVHPRTGLMKRNPKRLSWQRARKEQAAAEAAERAARMRELSPDLQLHRFDEVWWEVRLGRVANREKQTEGDVVIQAGLSALDPATLYGRHGVQAIAKRPLSKAEKKRHKLD